MYIALLKTCSWTIFNKYKGVNNIPYLEPVILKEMRDSIIFWLCNKPEHILDCYFIMVGVFTYYILALFLSTVICNGRLIRKDKCYFSFFFSFSLCLNVTDVQHRYMWNIYMI